MGSSPVKEALEIFLKKYNIEKVTGAVDDVLLDYVVSILEDLGESGSSEDIDLEGFIEMMEAYIPGFSQIDSTHVCEWMFELAAKSAEKHVKEHSEVDISLKPASTEDENSPCGTAKDQYNCSNSNVTGKSDAGCLTNSKVDSQKEDELDPQIEILLEMFPDLCTVEVTHCLMLSSGDTDRAVQLLLHRQQTGDTISQSPQKHEIQDGDYTDKRPDVDLRDWTTKEIIEWLTANELYTNKALKRLSADDLNFLWFLYNKCTAYFFEYCKKELGISRLSDMRRLNNAMLSLS